MSQSLPRDVRVVAASITYEQPADEMQLDGMPTQRIKLSIEDTGLPPHQVAYPVLKTKRWAFDDATQLHQLLEDFAARLPELREAILVPQPPAVSE
jgi:hypothetical protein